jgi:hypothetical protein
MPIALERELRAEADKVASSGRMRKRKRGQSLKDAENAYVWGTMRKIERYHRAKGGAPGKYMKTI